MRPDYTSACAHTLTIKHSRLLATRCTLLNVREFLRSHQHQQPATRWRKWSGTCVAGRTPGIT